MHLSPWHLSPLHRRSVLLGASGALLAGCSGSATSTRGGETPAPGTPSPSPSGPVIQQQGAGNVLTDADVQDLVDRLNEVVRNGDLRGLRRMVRTFDEFDVREWRARLGSLPRMPLDELRFVYEASTDRKVNAAGGPLEFTANLALAHRFEGCDQFAVSQIYAMDLVKPSTDAAVSILRISSPFDGNSPAPWDLGGFRPIRGERCWVLARERDVAKVRSSLATIDAGVADAMRTVAPPRGVTKVCMAVAPEGSRVFGGIRIPEVAGIAASAPFVEPADAAGAPEDMELVRADRYSSRIVLYPGAFSEGADFLREIAAHETAHALANQWGRPDERWVAEGFGEYVGLGLAAGFRSRSATTSTARAGIAAFREQMVAEDPPDFYDLTSRGRNYACAAAVFALVEEREGGAGAAVALARACYQEGHTRGVKKVLGGSPARLHDETAAWLEAL